MSEKNISEKILKDEVKSFELATKTIKAGELVGLPTETVYGLAANALDDRAVLNIYKAKERPSYNPLIVHVSGVDMAMAVAEVSPLAKKLMQEFWPGPLTLVLKRLSDCPLSEFVSAGLDSVALRCPNHPMALKLLKHSKLPLAAPSANKSGSISPTTARHVLDGLGDEVAYILDGGEAEIGVESSIIAVEDNEVRLLRPGAITKTMIENVVGKTTTVKTRTNSPDKIIAPGQLESHYAPEHSLRLNVTAANSGEFLLGFGKINGQINLSPNGNLDEAAHNLFAMLRTADQQASSSIAIAPIPNEGIGRAINDRINRAATPKNDALKES